MSSTFHTAIPAPFACKPTETPGRGYRILIGSAILIGLVAVVYVTLSGELFRPAREAIAGGDWQAAILRPSLLWVAMAIVMLTLRTLLWFCYRPYPAATYDNAPMLTVVIPAYNEGAMVEQSIESVAHSDYPRDRLEILVVDDVSTEDTWQ